MSGANAKRAKTRLQRPMPGNFEKFAFNRDLLPHPAGYYSGEGIKLLGSGNWRDALCPFHKDTEPSLRVLVEKGAFRCMTCRARGCDVLAFHMQRHGLGFVEAAKELGAWRAVR